SADIHGTVINNLTYQETPFGPQVPTGAFEITTEAVAYDAPFGPTVVNLAAAVGLITPDQLAFYNSLPEAGAAASVPNDNDEFLKSLIDGGLAPLGYDPVGLNNNLPIANGLINATLLKGDYIATHTYGWTEFDIDEKTQKLTVTTWGIPAYTQADLQANPGSVTNRKPVIVSQFVVTPKLGPTAELVGSKLVVTGTGGDDDIDVSVKQGGSVIEVRVNGKKVGQYDRAEVGELNVFALGGNDRITVSNQVD